MTSAESGLSGTLPIRLPIFPLPGALLLPGGNLPLNIFEPRYLQMTRDAMRTDRLIGMIQPDRRAARRRPARRLPDRLRRAHHQFTETEDGRYLITLTGLVPLRAWSRSCRVDTRLPPGRPDFARWQRDLEPPTPSDSLRPPLVGALRGYFEATRSSADWEPGRGSAADAAWSPRSPWSARSSRARSRRCWRPPIPSSAPRS